MQNFLLYYAKFSFLNHIGFEPRLPNGAETVLDEYAYNDMGFVSSYKRYTAPGEYTEARYTHDCTGNVLSEKVYETDGTLLREISYEISISRDSKSKYISTVTRSISGGGADFAKYSESTDRFGNIVERKYTSGANERTYTYTYDIAGNELTETDPLGSVTATAYDVFHNPVSVTYADGSQVSYEYNALNLVTQKTDALGNISRYEYDAAGRLLNEYNPLADNAEMQSKTDYDANGNVISKKTKTGSMLNNVVNFVGTEYSYDSMNRLAYSFAAPDTNQKLYTVYSYNSAGNPVSVTTRTGSLTNTSSDRVTAYTYDSLGRMTGETAPDGKTKGYEYDLQGRKLKITDAANVQDIYTYDAFDNVTSRTRGGEAVTYAYNALGKRTSMTDSTGTSTYTYNPFGELTAENKDDILKSYSYDALGRRTSFSAVKGTQSIISNAYTYDVLGRLTAVTNGEDTAAYTYDANSNRLTTTVNGVLKSSAAYNKANLPTEVNSYVSGNLKSTETYKYYYNGFVNSYLMQEPQGMYVRKV